MYLCIQTRGGYWVFSNMALHLLHPLGLRLQYAVLPDFCVGAVDPNSGSHVCVTGALPTEPHPQAQTRFCCFFLII